MPSLSTLVDDVLHLFEGHLAVGEDAQLDTVIKRRLKEHLESRKGGSLRCSSLGHPLRMLWYEHNQPEKAEPLTAENKFKFLLGDILESLLLYLARQAGHTVEREQEEIEVDGVVGHIDAVINGVVVDIKSASSQSFKRFTKDNIPFDVFLSRYLYQLAAYSKALNLPGAFLIIDKQMGKLRLIEYSQKELDNLDVSGRIEKIRECIGYVTPPDFCYQPIDQNKKESNGNKILPIPCQYCNFKKECHKNSNDGMGLRAFKYAYKIEWFTHIEKLPKVDEIIED